MQSLEIYTRGLHFIERILDRAARNEKLDASEIREHANLVMQYTLQSSDDFLQLTARSTPENFLLAHSLNCSILAILIGQNMGYSTDKLGLLATAALLHDAGMMKMFDWVNSPMKFSKKDREEVEKHATYSAEMMDQLEGFDSNVKEAILQHHEDEDGTGYPAHLKEGKIHELASILHAVDVYEALSHARPHRPAMLPHAAIKETVDSKQHFNRQVLKALINVVSLFPLGTYVQLNTRAIGKVVKVNKASFMRPTLQMLISHDGRILTDQTLLDMTSNINVHVERCLEENEILRLTSEPEQFLKIHRKQREADDAE